MYQLRVKPTLILPNRTEPNERFLSKLLIQHVRYQTTCKSRKNDVRCSKLKLNFGKDTNVKCRLLTDEVRDSFHARLLHS